MDIGTNTKKYRAIHLKGLRRGQTQRYTELHMEGYKYGGPCKNTWGHTHKGTQGGSDTHGETRYLQHFVRWYTSGLLFCVEIEVFAFVLITKYMQLSIQVPISGMYIQVTRPAL